MATLTNIAKSSAVTLTNGAKTSTSISNVSKSTERDGGFPYGLLLVLTQPILYSTLTNQNKN